MRLSLYREMIAIFQQAVAKILFLVSVIVINESLTLAAESAIQASIEGSDATIPTHMAPVVVTAGLGVEPYGIERTKSATRLDAELTDIPQTVSIVSAAQIRDQQMLSLGDVVRYVPGVSSHQGENNRDQIIFRGNSSSADFFYNGVRDDVQYYRDLYNLERVEILKGPNAMEFGRGGGGGVINRVTKTANFNPSREMTIQAGSFGANRLTADVDQPLNEQFALRVNLMDEHSDSFRDFVRLERYGLNPSLTYAPDAETKLTASYEHLHDARTADRGITSFRGSPVDVPISTYFGNPQDSHVLANVDIGSLAGERQLGELQLSDRLVFANYRRSYQNDVPGAVDNTESHVSLSAYNNATARKNIFNQFDVSYSVDNEWIKQTYISGIEWGRQFTDNFRNTGYFNNRTTTFLVDLDAPTIDVPTTFRQSATDANNHLTTDVGSAFLQSQIEISHRFIAISGLRFDSFDLKYHNNRTGDDLSRVDRLWSPRLGLVFQPNETLSIYTSYSVSFLPSSGDQFSSLTSITEQVKPENFTNKEVGVKWNVMRRLAVTGAFYQLDRTNTRSIDPSDPTRIVQTGSQRTDGFELEATGNLTKNWSIAGGFAYQDAWVRSATVSAGKGARVAQVPRQNISLWNKYRISTKWSVGLGLVSHSSMFAAIDNTVTLPGYTRIDAGLYFSINQQTRLQLNIENALDKRYYANADNNTNISPGAPRTFRVALEKFF